MSALLISPQLSLPLDAITETFALLAVRRAGKSNAAVVMAEEMYDNGLPWVAIDPKGDWWGIRAAGDGKAPGLSVLVFGGLHGDVPLEPTAGKLVADLIVEQRLTCVLDVSEMEGADMRRFLTAFAQRLYQRNSEPLHVFCEEADEYIPQMVRNDSTHLVGAFERLIKRGGFRGIGVTLITQRSASLNKDVLTQVGTLIPMRTPSPQDRKAILAWVAVHDAGKDLVDALPGLDNGEAYVFSPQWLDTLVKIKFRRRRTFDSGATPKVGGKPRPPATLADVDLDQITAAMAETIEKQKAEDPQVLRKRIAELEREVAKTPAAPEPIVETVEVSVLTDYDRTELGMFTDSFREIAKDLQNVQHGVEQLLSRVAPPEEPKRRVAPVSSDTSRRTPPARRASRPPENATEGDVKLGKTERTIMAVLAQHGPRTHNQLALLTGYSPKASTIGVALGKLRRIGFVADGQPISATEQGLDWVGDDVEPLPTGEALLDYWRNKFGKTERAVLDAFLSVYPNTTSQDEVADITGYSAGASTIGVALGKLRRVGVLEGWNVSDDFAESAGIA